MTRFSTKKVRLPVAVALWVIAPGPLSPLSPGVGRWGRIWPQFTLGIMGIREAIMRRMKFFTVSWDLMINVLISNVTRKFLLGCFSQQMPKSKVSALLLSDLKAPLTTRPAASSLRTAPNKKNASRTAFLSPAAGQQQTAAQAAADQSAAAAAADKKKTAEQPRAVTKERVKRPVEFPEDIGTLLPPEWGGEAAKLDTPKVKGKQPGKVSLTA
ncbi:hypothetical protein WJX82_010181 [Trebouxia sp. C0006]